MVDMKRYYAFIERLKTDPEFRAEYIRDMGITLPWDEKLQCFDTSSLHEGKVI